MNPVPLPRGSAAVHTAAPDPRSVTDPAAPAATRCPEASAVRRRAPRLARLLEHPVRKALVPAVLATTVLGVFAVVQPRGSDAHGAAVEAAPPAGLRVGAVCSSDIDYATEVSCGLGNFGDVRFRCGSAGTAAAPCPRTRIVTLENTGRTALRLVTVSGSAPGERHETVSRLLRPGTRTALGPRAGDTYLYDIVLRFDAGPAQARVVALS